MKKALTSLAFMALLVEPSFAQTAGQSVMGFLLPPGQTYGSYTCPSANIGPCFVQYGSSIPTTGGGGTAQDVNLKSVNGVTVLTGAGATGTGSERTTVAQDTTTIAGSAPGTAGTPSANVVTIQGVTNGTPLPLNIGITPTDRTVTSLTGSSQTLMAANASRHSLTVVNTGTSNIGINPTGGTAVIGGAGTLTLVPGGSYTPRIPTLSAVTVIGTAAQPAYANEN